MSQVIESTNKIQTPAGKAYALGKGMTPSLLLAIGKYIAEHFSLVKASYQ